MPGVERGYMLNKIAKSSETNWTFIRQYTVADSRSYLHKNMNSARLFLSLINTKYIWSPDITADYSLREKQSM